MAYTYHELKAKTVAELREVAAGIEHDAVKGHTQMNKEHLLVALCNALNIDTREHRVAKAVDKAAIKATLKLLKARRATSLQSHDRKQLKTIRHELHELKKKLRRAAETAG
jgi:hypothetical protein